MSKLSRSLGVLAALSLVGSLAAPSAMAAKEPVSNFSASTSQAIFKDTAHLEEKKLSLLVVTDSTGVKTIEVKAKESVSKALSRNGLLIENFRTEDGDAVEDGKLAKNTLFLFRVEYEGSAKRFSIPAPVTKLRVNGLPEGTRIVQEKGAKGQGIMTTVLEQDLSSDRSLNGLTKKNKANGQVSTETLTVVRAPKPKVVLVSTPLEYSETGDFDSPEGECDNGSSVPDSVTGDLIALHRATCVLFPEVSTYGTYRDSCTYSCDHRDGYATDIMVSGELGWKLATYLTSMAETFNIYYLIYEQKIWTREEPYWRAMDDRGSITANHFDHVHVSFNRSEQQQ